MKRKNRNKILDMKFKTVDDFIEAVSEDCVQKLTEEDRAYLKENPNPIHYHMTYCLGIRNRYIYNSRFMEEHIDRLEPDGLSGDIMDAILAKVLPEEFDADNSELMDLYRDEKYILLRGIYMEKYGEYPKDYVREYLQKVSSFERPYIPQLVSAVRNEMLMELAEEIWDTEKFVESLAEYGLCYGDVEEAVNEIKSIFIKEGCFLPFEISLLLHRKAIGKEKYVAYRRELYQILDEGSPYLISMLDEAYFKDRVLARHVLKWGSNLKHLKMYQDDDAMVRYCLKHDGLAIKFASERIRTDYEWIKYAILHSGESFIMSLKCMKPYRNDRELVYLACKNMSWNLDEASEDLKNDYELVKMCMEDRRNYHDNSVYRCLSPEMKQRREFIWMDLNVRNPSISDYPDEWKDSDELAARLYELHGTDTYAWYFVSERLRKKYGIEEGCD